MPAPKLTSPISSYIIIHPKHIWCQTRHSLKMHQRSQENLLIENHMSIEHIIQRRFQLTTTRFLKKNKDMNFKSSVLEKKCTLLPKVINKVHSKARFTWVILTAGHDCWSWLAVMFDQLIGVCMGHFIQADLLLAF